MDCLVLRHAGRHGDTPLGSQDSGPFRDGCVSCPGTDHFSPCPLCPRARCVPVPAVSPWLTHTAPWGSAVKIPVHTGETTLSDCEYEHERRQLGQVAEGTQQSGTRRGTRDAEGTHRLSLPMLVPSTNESRSDPGQGIAPAFLFSRQAGQCRAAAHNRVAICMPQAQRPGNCPFSASRGIGLLESVQQNAEQFCPGAAICPRCSRFSRLFSVPHDAHNGSKAVPGWFLVQLIPPPPLPPYLRYGLPNCCLRQAT